MARKKATAIPHAKQRCRQRYGMALHKDLACRIVKAIQTGGSVFVRRTSSHRTIQEVQMPEGRFQVVYDSQRKALITFLPVPAPVEMSAFG